jgi:hypothetical protein
VLLLNTVNDLLRVTPSSANALDCFVSFVDTTTTTTLGGRQRTSLAAAAAATVLASPAASTERVVKFASFCARGGANNVIPFWTDGTTEQLLGGTVGVALATGETLIYTDTEGWRVHDIAGQIKYIVSTGGVQGHLIRVDGVDSTQRAAINFIDTSSVAFAPTDDGANNETELRATVPNNGITTAMLAQAAARTFRGNPTLALANVLDNTAQVMRENITGGVLTQSTSQTQTASVTNLTNGTYSIAANTAEVGSMWEIEAQFYAGRGATVTATNLIIELLVNAVVIRTCTIAINVTASAVRSGSVVGRISFRTIGGAGTAMITLSADSDLPSAAAGTSVITADPVPAAAAPAATVVDTTVTRTVELRMRLSAATATVFVHMLHCKTIKVR